MQAPKVYHKRIKFVLGAIVTGWLITNITWLALDNSSLVPLVVLTLSTIAALTVFLSEPR
ncbi:hypothetical protein QWY77_11090 [Thalassotalea ponticola]|nr:hypothetical protein [Thalassotalea ponticola]